MSDPTRTTIPDTIRPEALADTEPAGPYDPRQGPIDWLEARLGAKAWDAIVMVIVEGDKVQWCSRTGIAALIHGGGATDYVALNRGSINPDGKWHAGQDFIRLENWARAHGAWHVPGDGYEPQKSDALFVLRDNGRQLHYATIAGPGDAPGTVATIEGNSHYTAAAPHGQIARGQQVYSKANVRGCVDVGSLLGQGIMPVEPLPIA